MFQYEGNDCGAGYTLDEQMRKNGVPPHWLAYVTVESAAATAEKAKQLGATVLAGPMDVSDKGVMAVIRDPQGAVFGVWQAKSAIGATNGDVNWRHCWTELATPDIQAARDFYTKLFGWGIQAQQMGEMEYTSWLCSAGPTGGGFQMTGDMWKGIPPHWLVYFSVPDCDQIAAKVTAAGGKICVPPTDIPNVGRFSVCMDPAGAAFSIIKLTMA
jgi:predicted enzyme related to lactoylglutathione lyase